MIETLALSLTLYATQNAPEKNTVEYKRQTVVEQAAKLKGIPYRYGGTTKNGFDCSGYTQHIYKKISISLPRTAEAQRQKAKTVPANKAEKGDLVFFGKPAYHVGIYAGKHQIWHSPRSGRTVSKDTIWTHATYGKIVK